MSLAQRLAIVAMVEIAYIVATRLVLHYLSWKSLEAESIRTALRLGTAAIYWYLFKPLLLSRTPDLRLLAHPLPAASLALFFSIPFVVGRYALDSGTAILFALASIPVAIKEEFLFRGIMQNLLAARLGPVNAILLTSAVFTVWHVGVWEMTPWVVAQIFFASVLLGLVYVHSGSMLAVIIIHAVYDALFSFTPLIPEPLHENWGFVPLLGAVALMVCWAARRRTAHSTV